MADKLIVKGTTARPSHSAVGWVGGVCVGQTNDLKRVGANPPSRHSLDVMSTHDVGTATATIRTGQ